MLRQLLLGLQLRVRVKPLMRLLLLLMMMMMRLLLLRLLLHLLLLLLLILLIMSWLLRSHARDGGGGWALEHRVRPY